MKYYWAQRFDDSLEEVTQEKAKELESQGEFVTNSYASAIFYLCA
jgi:hypothetical protein